MLKFRRGCKKKQISEGWGLNRPQELETLPPSVEAFQSGHRGSRSLQEPLNPRLQSEFQFVTYLFDGVGLVEVFADSRHHGEHQAEDEDVEDAGHGAEAEAVGVLRVGGGEGAPTLALVYPPHRPQPRQLLLLLVLQNPQRDILSANTPIHKAYSETEDSRDSHGAC